MHPQNITHSFRNIALAILALVFISPLAVPLLADAQPVMSGAVNIQVAPANNSPAACGAPAILCADGRTIEPGPDCRYHDSCVPAATVGGGGLGGSKGISCGAPDILCDDGRVISPGPDCRYYETCESKNNTTVYETTYGGGIVGGPIGDVPMPIPDLDRSSVLPGISPFTSWYSAILDAFSGSGGSIFDITPSRPVRCPADIRICADGTAASRGGPNCTFDCSGRKMPPGDGRGYICAQDAMRCPDGSYVGRTGPDCSFVCPSTTGTRSDKPISCGAPAIRCADGKIIEPGDDCRYHDSCESKPLGSEGGGFGSYIRAISASRAPSTFETTAGEGFPVFAPPTSAPNQTFGSRIGSIFGKFFSIPAWLGGGSR